MSLLPSYNESLISLEDALGIVKNMPDELRKEEFLQMAADLFYRIQLEKKGLKKVCDVYVNPEGKYIIQYDESSLTPQKLDENMLCLSEKITKRAVRELQRL